VNGPPQFQSLEIVHVLDANRARQAGCLPRPLGIGAHAANLLGQANLGHVTGLAAFDQAQSALRGQPPNGLPRGSAGEVDIASQPKNRKTQPPPAFQPAVPHEVDIDHMVDNRQP